MLVVNSRFLSQDISGVQRYAIEICRELKKIQPNIVFIAPKNILHHDLADELNVDVVGNLTGHLWEQFELPRYLKKQGKPLLLNLCNTAPLFYEKKMVTLHDVSFVRYPKTFSWKFCYAYQFIIPRILKSSKKVITVSDFSASEISTVYGLKKQNIAIVYNSVSDLFKCRDMSQKDRYILAVSSLNFHKNFHSLIKAFNLINVEDDIKLYLVGGINKNFADKDLLADIAKNPNIEFKGRVDDDELVNLYSGAECFVYPSLYEGFGIPPLEAQACGCPCVVSNSASLPEVCADSVEYCDPHSINNIVLKLERVLSDKDLRNILREKGYKNIMRFSWKRSAEQIIKLVEDLK